MSKFKTIIVFVSVWFVFNQINYAQNMVVNPSFEDVNTANLRCSWYLYASEFNAAINNWTMPTEGSTDIFHSSLSTSCFCHPLSTDANRVGQQSPRTGSGMSAIVTYGNGGCDPWREYLQGRLSSAMVPGQQYKVEFYVSQADEMVYASNNLGVYFTTSAWFSANGGCVYYATPQVNYTSIITNQTSWTLVSMTFTATQAYTYFTIGNFYNDAATSVINVGGTDAMCRYFVDDVNIYPACTPPSNPTPTASPSTICSGSPSTLSASVTGASIYWYTGSCGGTLVGSGNSITVTPGSTTTYYARSYNSTTGCWSSGCGSVTVNVNPRPSNPAPSASPSTICAGNSSNLSATVSGAIMYWYTGSCGGTLIGTGNSITVTPSSTRTYYVRSYNATTGCWSSGCGSVTVTVSIPANPSPNASPSAICTGNSSSLSATVSGSTIYWYTGSCGGVLIGTGSPITVSPGITTTYYARAYNTSGCWSTGCGSVTVTVNSPPAIVTVNGGGTYCESKTITASGGTGGTIYWQGTTNNGTSTATPSTSQAVTSSGTYYFRAYNSCGWGTQGSATVTIGNPITQTISGTTPLCTGSSQTWTSTTTGGTWTSSVTSIATVGSSNGTVSGISAGTSRITYSVTIGGCVNTATKTVTITAPINQTITGTTPLCAGSTATWSGTTSGGTWSSSATSIATVGSSNGTVTGMSAGTSRITYSVTIGGCVNTATKTVTITAPVNQTITGTTPLCAGSTATWSGTTSGGSWSSSATSIATVGSSNGTVTGISAGTSRITYSVTIGGCVNTATKTITITAPITQTISGTTPVCVGSSQTWNSTTNGGIWTSSATSIATVGSSNGTVSGISAGTSRITYSVTIGGCVNTATKTVTITAPITQTITGTTPVCVGSSQTWNSTTNGGIWTSSATSIATVGSSNGTVSGISAGTSRITYSVTIGGCVNTATKTVTITAPITQTITGTTPLCAGSTATWSGTTSGGTWSSSSTGVATVNASSGLVTAIGAGTALITYSVTSGACVNTGTKTITVTAPTAQTISGTNPVCVGSAATWTSTTSGGTWNSASSGVATISSSTGVLTGISAGTALISYSVTSGACVNTATKTVTISAPITQTITGTTPVCVGSTAAWTSTTSGGTWTSTSSGVATIGASTGIITGISAGNALISYSVTSGACVNTATKTVSITAPTIQTLSGTTPLCVSSTATWAATTSGGIWNSSNTGVATVNSSTGIITATGAGTSLITYSVTAGACVNTGTKTLTVNAPVAQTITGIDLLCVGSTATWSSTTSGGIWNSSSPVIASVNSSTGVVTGVAFGTAVISYSVSSGACINTATKTVTVNNTTGGGISGGTSPVCYNGNPGIFTATGTGGTGTYTYQWYTTSSGIINGATYNTYSPGNIAATNGYYCVLTSGACGSANTDTTIINVFPQLTVDPIHDTSICTKTNPGTFTANVHGGTGPYSYLWYWDGTSTGVTSSTYNPGIIQTNANFHCVITNTCGTLTTPVIHVTIISPVGNPAPIIVGGGTEPLCQLTNGTTTTLYTTNAPNATSYNWSISNPAAGGIDANTGLMTWANGFYGTVNIEVSANGCDGPSIMVTRTVIVNFCGTGHNISGKTRYCGKANNGNPIPNPPTYNSVIYDINKVIVILKNYPSGNEIARDTSDALGAFLFSNVADGSYMLSYDKFTDDTMQWGDNINAIDVAIVKYFVGSDTLVDPSRCFSAKYKRAANVDNNALINSIDIARLKAKVGNPASAAKNFPDGNWPDFDTIVTVAGADLNVILKTICYGDYNASSSKYKDSVTTWSMAKSISTNIINVSDEYITTSDPSYFEIPLRINSKMNDFSALGLELSYPANDYSLERAIMIKAVKNTGPVKINPTLEEIIADDNDLLVTEENGIIRVVFATTAHFDVAANDELIRLGFRSHKKMIPGEVFFDLNGTGVIGDQYGEENQDAYLLMPKILVQSDNAENGFEFAAYPNPFNNNATITYNLPQAGTVKLLVYNAIGELVMELVHEAQEAGRHSVMFSADDLPSGMYTFKLDYDGLHSAKRLVLKLIH